MTTLAIIGGTGLNEMKGLHVLSTELIETPFGLPSVKYVHGRLNGRDLIFLARHGNPHSIAPHNINYRANIWGLNKLGVTDIIAVAAVGGITEAMKPAHIVIPDQLIDYSYGREHTFFAEDTEAVKHIDFTFPYNPLLRKHLISLAKKESLVVSEQGTYGCTQGPRLETPAEIIRMERDGCDLVGMTGMPEASLAKELGINYATIAVVVNWAAGKAEGEITMDEIAKHLKTGMVGVERLLALFAETATL